MAEDQVQPALTQSMVTAPAATALAAAMRLVGVILGAFINGYYNNRTSIELEQIKFETGLIIEAIKTTDHASAVKTLKFFANAGLISHYEARVSKLVLKENDLDVPSIGSGLQQLVTSPINSFAYQTSPNEIDAGRRNWQRGDTGHWTETYPKGKVSRFVTKAQISLNGCSGTVGVNEHE